MAYLPILWVGINDIDSHIFLKILIDCDNDIIKTYVIENYTQFVFWTRTTLGRVDETCVPHQDHNNFWVMAPLINERVDPLNFLGDKDYFECGTLKFEFGKYKFEVFFQKSIFTYFMFYVLERVISCLMLFLTK